MALQRVAQGAAREVEAQGQIALGRFREYLGEEVFGEDDVVARSRRLAGLAKARQLSAFSRLCRVTSILAEGPPPRPGRRPDSWAGMTLVSLKTSRSSGTQQVRQIAHMVVDHA